jgi:hypothetical protein
MFFYNIQATVHINLYQVLVTAWHLNRHPRRQFKDFVHIHTVKDVLRSEGCITIQLKTGFLCPFTPINILSLAVETVTNTSIINLTFKEVVGTGNINAGWFADMVIVVGVVVRPIRCHLQESWWSVNINIFQAALGSFPVIHADHEVVGLLNTLAAVEDEPGDYIQVPVHQVAEAVGWE